MAAGELTGKTRPQLDTMAEEHESSPLYENHGIPFETAYCLQRIGKQPEEYNGPQRYCVNRASKYTEEEWAERFEGAYQDYDTRCYCANCNFHGRMNGQTVENLEPYTANMRHGIYAEDEHLQMDFSEPEQVLYDGIVEAWPEIYDWPDRDEDPARYLMLEKVATNFVRTERAEDYLDDQGEVYEMPIFDDQGVEVGSEDTENPLAGEYRLLVREVTQMLKELGLTPKERARMGTQEQAANALDDITSLASEALNSEDKEYDPNEFEDAEDG